jgi:hypothetical protein
LRRLARWEAEAGVALRLAAGQGLPVLAVPLQAFVPELPAAGLGLRAKLELLAAPPRPELVVVVDDLALLAAVREPADLA